MNATVETRTVIEVLTFNDHFGGSGTTRVVRRYQRKADAEAFARTIRHTTTEVREATLQVVVFEGKVYLLGEELTLY